MNGRERDMNRRLSRENRFEYRKAGGRDSWSLDEHPVVDETYGLLPDETTRAAITAEEYADDVRQYVEERDRVARNIPALIDVDTVSRRTDHLPYDDIRGAVASLEMLPEDVYTELDEQGMKKLHQLNGFIANAYIHDEDADRLPPAIAAPLQETADRLGRQPILAYVDYAHHNHRIDDHGGSPQVDDFSPVYTFSGTEDEEWFIQVHLGIESNGGTALAAMPGAQRAGPDEPDALADALDDIALGLNGMFNAFRRMREGHDMEVFAEYRKYPHGFDDVVYEGTGMGTQSFGGGSGAQSALVPAFDHAFGITYENKDVMDEIRRYMPPIHRELLDSVDDAPAITDTVLAAEDDRLEQLHDACIKNLLGFRFMHKMVVAGYLSKAGDDGSGAFVPDYKAFLNTLIDTTEDQLIGEPADEQREYVKYASQYQPSA